MIHLTLISNVKYEKMLAKCRPTHDVQLHRFPFLLCFGSPLKRCMHLLNSIVIGWVSWVFHLVLPLLYLYWNYKDEYNWWKLLSSWSCMYLYNICNLDLFCLFQSTQTCHSKYGQNQLLVRFTDCDIINIRCHSIPPVPHFCRCLGKGLTGTTM